MSSPSRGRGYASGLDGIRALAVAAVIAYHAGVPYADGGFLGVDLFFVVSGYLVTALLQREHDRTGQIRLRAFWARRARRLLPALVLLLIVVCAAAAVLGHDLGAGLRTQLLGAVTFSSNWWQIATGASYLESMEPSLLTHLWSLAVEEQFYLLWPLVLITLLVRLRRRQPRTAVAMLAALASALAMALLYRGGDPTRVYVGSDTHGYGLLLGAALALARPPSQLQPIRGLGQRSPAWWGIGCLLVVLAGMTMLHADSALTYRGGPFLVNVAAVGLVAAAVRGRGPIQALMSHRLLRPLGQRSYSLYLWHWPALVIANRVLAPELGVPAATVLAVAAALLATELSWRLVEEPVRGLGLRRYLAAIGRVLVVPGRARPARRSVGWIAAGGLAVAVVTAACAVVTAPATSDLAVSLAAGQQALEQAGSRTDPAPTAEPPQSRSAAGSSGPSRAKAPTAAPTTKHPASSGAPPHPATRPAARSAAPPAPPAGDQIRMIGDSVMLASAPALLDKFPGVDIDAVVSRQLWDLPPLLEVDPRPYVVVGLGTNGTESSAEIRQALSTLPSGTVVVLVNTFGPQSWQDEANGELTAAAAGRSHTCVADWRSAIAGHQDLLAADDIHPGTEAARIYAAVVAGALARCR